MDKFAFINWDLTVEAFGYKSRNEITQKSQVIVRCSTCHEPKQITFKNIRERTPGKPYRPICKTCQQAEIWQNAEYRTNQSAKQSAAMKKVWQDDEYRQNIANKVAANTAANWQKDEFRNKVKAGLRKAHQTIDGYTEASTAQFRTTESRQKCKVAVNAKYAGDPEYRIKLAIASRLNWEDADYRHRVTEATRTTWADKTMRQRMSDLYNQPKYRAMFCRLAKQRWQDQEMRLVYLATFTAARLEAASKTSKRLWQDDAYRNKMIEILASEECRHKISESSKANWQNDAYRNKMIELYQSTDYKAKLSNAMKKLWLDPEYAAKVTKHFKSKQEDLLASYLTDMGIKFTRQKHIGHWSFDFLIEHNSKNILVEVQGDYWHRLERNIHRDASKATYTEQYHHDYVLKTIWEHDFLCPERTISIIGSWLGACKYDVLDFKLSDTIIKEADKSDTTLLFSKYHYTANGGRQGLNIGAYVGDILVACARFCGPTRNESASRLELPQRQLLELTRMVVHPSYQKKNLLSYLLSRAVSIIRAQRPGVKCLLTFADMTFGHTGAVYKASNWVHDGTIKPDYFYVNSTGHVIHKKTMWDHARKMSKSEADHATALGYGRRYGREKERFIYWL